MFRLGAGPVGFETHRVDSTVHHGHAQEVLDQLGGITLRDVDRLAAETSCLGETFLLEVADDHHRGTQQLSRDRRRQTDGAGPGDVDGGTHTHPGGDAAVVAGGEDVGEHRQVQHLFHRLIAVGELQQVPVRVGHQHVFGLTTDPAPHVHVPVGRTRAVRVDVETDLCALGLAVATASAGDVERHRHQVALGDELRVRSGLHDLAGDLVPQDQPRGCGGTPSHHVLVTTADVGGHDLQDRPMRNLASHVVRSNAGPVLEFELRVGDVGDLDLAGTLVHHTSVAAHVPLPCLSAPVGTVGGWSSPLIQR